MVTLAVHVLPTWLLTVPFPFYVESQSVSLYCAKSVCIPALRAFAGFQARRGGTIISLPSRFSVLVFLCECQGNVRCAT